MSNEQSSYKQIVKATSLFGGVQFITIIILVIKSKLVAVLLGPIGIGIVGLFTTILGLVGNITSFGLKVSSVKNIAEAHSSGNNERIGIIIGVFRKLVWATGLIGTLIILCSAKLLSELTFDNTDYTSSFVWLSITLLLNQISNGQIALLEGLRLLKSLAKASLLGSVLGLLLTIPIYYIWGMKGIVPVFIVTSLISLVLSYWFTRDIKTQKVVLSSKTIFKEGKSMLVMGFLISLTGVFDSAIEYLTRIFIMTYGSVKIVGLFTAGFAIVNTYVGMVFSAMLIDYYPRLSSVSNNDRHCKEIINQQAEIAILILAPLVIAFLLFIKIIIVVLYSKQFLMIDKMIYWAMLGILFKAVNWSVGIIVLAKGKSKLYFFIYILAFLIMLGTNIGGFYFWGLEGLGIAFLISNILMSIISYIVAQYFYSFSFDEGFIKIFTIQLFLSIICFLLVQFIPSPFNYILGTILFICSLLYSYKELDKRININVILNTLKEKLKGKLSKQ